MGCLTVLVGIDHNMGGGSVSERTVSFAISLILEQDIDVKDTCLAFASCVVPEPELDEVLSHVGSPGKSLFGTDIVPTHEQNLESATQVLTEFSLRARAFQIPTKSVVLERKHAGVALVGLAEELGADFVVVGSRDQGLVERTVIGSVSDYVLHHSHCAVLVVNSRHEVDIPEKSHRRSFSLDLEGSVFSDIISSPME